MLGWGRSHRTSSDGELIRWGRDLARVEGRVGNDVLTNVTADQFAIELNGPLSPGVFKPVGDEQYVHVVMPVRTTS